MSKPTKPILKVKSDPQGTFLHVVLDSMSIIGPRRYIGWGFDADGNLTHNPTVVTELQAQSTETYSEYLRALKAGELIPADEATATTAGLKFPLS